MPPAPSQRPASRLPGSLQLTFRLCLVLQMDHDPRKPAYIATQGPLPATVADFWQVNLFKFNFVLKIGSYHMDLA